MSWKAEFYRVVSILQAKHSYQCLAQNDPQMFTIAISHHVTLQKTGMRVWITAFFNAFPKFCLIILPTVYNSRLLLSPSRWHWLQETPDQSAHTAPPRLGGPSTCTTRTLALKILQTAKNILGSVSLQMLSATPTPNVFTPFTSIFQVLVYIHFLFG